MRGLATAHGNDTDHGRTPSPFMCKLVLMSQLIADDPVGRAKALDRTIVCLKFPHREDCMICHDSLFGRRTTVYSCGHTLHLACDKRLRASSCPSRNFCPMCRTQVRPFKLFLSLEVELEGADIFQLFRNSMIFDEIVQELASMLTSDA